MKNVWSELVRRRLLLLTGTMNWTKLYCMSGHHTPFWDSLLLLDGDDDYEQVMRFTVFNVQKLL